MGVGYISAGRYLTVAISMLAFACGGSENNSFKPPANFLAGQLLVIADTAHWKQALGTALRRQVAAPVAGLPQQEPAFDLISVPPAAVNSTLQRTAAVLFVVLHASHSPANEQLKYLFRSYLPKENSADTARLYFFRDFYARGQRAALLLAKDSTDAIALLAQRHAVLSRYFVALEREYLIKKLSAVFDDTLKAGLDTRLGFSLQVPKTYALAKEHANFVWLRYTDAVADKNFFIHKAPYTDSSVFSNIPAYREAITTEYLRDSQKSHLYITAQQEVPFHSEVLSFQGRYAVRSAGLWKLSDNSIGGPFVSYLLPDTTDGHLYYLETFLYQPGSKKRDMLREMESLLWTFSHSAATSK